MIGLIYITNSVLQKHHVVSEVMKAIAAFGLLSRPGTLGEARGHVIRTLRKPCGEVNMVKAIITSPL